MKTEGKGTTDQLLSTRKAPCPAPRGRDSFADEFLGFCCNSAILSLKLTCKHDVDHNKYYD